MSSTGETYAHPKYELLTPSGDGRIRISFFKYQHNYVDLKTYVLPVANGEELFQETVLGAPEELEVRIETTDSLDKVHILV